MKRKSFFLKFFSSIFFSNSQFFSQRIEQELFNEKMKLEQERLALEKMKQEQEKKKILEEQIQQQERQRRIALFEKEKQQLSNVETRVTEILNKRDKKKKQQQLSE